MDMGKFVRKEKVPGDLGVMELAAHKGSSLGVLTRAKTLALRRLQQGGALDPSAFSYLELRSRRLQKRFPAAATGTVRRERVKSEANPSPTKPAAVGSPSASMGPEVESEPRKMEEDGGMSSLGGKEEEEKDEGSGASPGIDAGVEVSFGDNAAEIECVRLFFVRNFPNLGFHFSYALSRVCFSLKIVLFRVILGI